MTDPHEEITEDEDHYDKEDEITTLKEIYTFIASFEETDFETITHGVPFISFYDLTRGLDKLKEWGYMDTRSTDYGQRIFAKEPEKPVPEMSGVNGVNPLSRTVS